MFLRIIVTEILCPNSVMACAGVHDVSSSPQRDWQKAPASELVLHTIVG